MSSNAFELFGVFVSFLTFDAFSCLKVQLTIFRNLYALIQAQNKANTTRDTRRVIRKLAILMTILNTKLYLFAKPKEQIIPINTRITLTIRHNSTIRVFIALSSNQCIISSTNLALTCFKVNFRACLKDVQASFIEEDVGGLTLGAAGLVVDAAVGQDWGQEEGEYYYFQHHYFMLIVIVQFIKTIKIIRFLQEFYKIIDSLFYHLYFYLLQQSSTIFQLPILSHPTTKTSSQDPKTQKSVNSNLPKNTKKFSFSIPQYNQFFNLTSSNILQVNQLKFSRHHRHQFNQEDLKLMLNQFMYQMLSLLLLFHLLICCQNCLHQITQTFLRIIVWNVCGLCFGFSLFSFCFFCFRIFYQMDELSSIQGVWGQAVCVAIHVHVYVTVHIHVHLLHFYSSAVRSIGARGRVGDDYGAITIQIGSIEASTPESTPLVNIPGSTADTTRTAGVITTAIALADMAAEGIELTEVKGFTEPIRTNQVAFVQASTHHSAVVYPPTITDHTLTHLSESIIYYLYLFYIIYRVNR